MYDKKDKIREWMFSWKSL